MVWRRRWPAHGKEDGLPEWTEMTARLDAGDYSWGGKAVLLVGDGGVAGGAVKRRSGGGK